MNYCDVTCPSCRAINEIRTCVRKRGHNAYTMGHKCTNDHIWEMDRVNGEHPVLCSNSVNGNFCAHNAGHDGLCEYEPWIWNQEPEDCIALPDLLPTRAKGRSMAAKEVFG